MLHNRVLCCLPLFALVVLVSGCGASWRLRVYNHSDSEVAIVYLPPAIPVLGGVAIPNGVCVGRVMPKTDAIYTQTNALQNSGSILGCGVLLVGPCNGSEVFVVSNMDSVDERVKITRLPSGQWSIDQGAGQIAVLTDPTSMRDLRNAFELLNHERSQSEHPRESKR